MVEGLVVSEWPFGKSTRRKRKEKNDEGGVSAPICEATAVQKNGVRVKRSKGRRRGSGLGREGRDRAHICIRGIGNCLNGSMCPRIKTNIPDTAGSNPIWGGGLQLSGGAYHRTAQSGGKLCDSVCLEKKTKIMHQGAIFFPYAQESDAT